MIEGQGIIKTYGQLPVLKGIDLAIQPGEVVALVGASGAGKSTLLHILGTLDAPDAGTITIDGQRIDQLQGKALSHFRNTHIGFVFQFHHLLPEFTALENVCMPGFIGRQPEKQVTQRAHELLDLLGLTARATHKPRELSGGEQQRVAVARALINQPKVVFADEPSGNLDSTNSRELHALFFTLRDELGQTFVIATHNEELSTMSDRRLRIVDGRLQEQ